MLMRKPRSAGAALVHRASAFSWPCSALPRDGHQERFMMLTCSSLLSGCFHIRNSCRGLMLAAWDMHRHHDA
jgi:hypothetical protein